MKTLRDLFFFIMENRPCKWLLAVATVSVAAGILVLARRRRRVATRAKRNSQTRIFLVRHGERQDHEDPQWAAQAARSHDSPLSDAGFEQARRAGEHLRGRDIDHHSLFIRSSPLVRTVQTAAHISAGLDMPGLLVQVDEALCEEERFLRPRMMGNHRKSVAPAARTAVPPTCEGAPRGVCKPILLRPGDLLSIHRSIDQTFRGTACLVEHDPATGVELNGVTLQPQSADERAEHIVNGLPRLVPVGSTTILVTHGAFAKRLGERLLGENTPGGGFGAFGYAEVCELVCDTGEDCGHGKWHVVGERFAPAGESGRHTHA